jgi:hypothetical protein
MIGERLLGLRFNLRRQVWTSSNGRLQNWHTGNSQVLLPLSDSISYPHNFNFNLQ